MESGQLPVTLRDGTSWDKSVSVEVVSLLLLNLLQNDFRINDNFVFEIMGIDMEERRRGDNVPHLTDPSTQGYRMINRAMAMELLSSQLLCHIDWASEVRAMCRLRHGLPHTAAREGTGDVVVRYDQPDGSLAFRVVAEVSSQNRVTEEFYRRQLNQAWKFAKELSEDDEDGLVYGLVINRGEIGSDNELRRWYREFAEEKKIVPDSNVRVLPLYAGDLASAALRIQEELPTGRLQFNAWNLGSILDALLESLQAKMSSDAGHDWMRDRFVEMVPDNESDDAGSAHAP